MIRNLGETLYIYVYFLLTITFILYIKKNSTDFNI